MEAIIGHFQAPLQSYLSRLCGSRELAEDLAQETFVRVLANLDRFDDRFRFSTWLFTIARRLWMNHLNKHRPVADRSSARWWCCSISRAGAWPRSRVR